MSNEEEVKQLVERIQKAISLSVGNDEWTLDWSYKLENYLLERDE